MIYMEDICKTYHIGDETIHALDHANLQVQDGEFVAVVGPSGSGKSTLMNIMGCLDTADSGIYLLDNEPIVRMSQNQLAHVRNKKIGFIFQNFNLLPRLTALENVELPLIYGGVPTSDRRSLAENALRLVGLEKRTSHRPTELSGGQQQRVAIARALAGNPPVLLADEPTGNLDSSTGNEIMQIFDELHEAGKTIVLITHDSHVASRAQREIHIADGRVTGGVA
ncbi:MAG: ABC transporter ATP-binding protein [Clostridia bacterium]|nr:ABC transporter ATP-binding protein [Clostridia bacterium]